jgi:hypothetical protein
MHVAQANFLSLMRTMMVVLGKYRVARGKAGGPGNVFRVALRARETAVGLCKGNKEGRKGCLVEDIGRAVGQTRSTGTSLEVATGLRKSQARWAQQWLLLLWIQHHGPPFHQFVLRLEGCLSSDETSNVTPDDSRSPLSAVR